MPRPRRALALAALCFALTAPPCAPLAAAPAGPTGWTLSPLTPANAGSQGPRLPTLDGGSRLAFTSDGDLAPGDPGNADGNVEVFQWDAGRLRQVTDTSRAMGGFPSQSRAFQSRTGSYIAFLSNADLTGANADRSVEVFRAEFTPGPVFSQVTDGRAGTAAEGPAADGVQDAQVFWHTGDLTGDNPDGGLELFLSCCKGPAPRSIAQLTRLTGKPYHSLPAISDRGDAVAFVLAADLTGGNPDGGQELFLWRGPPTRPGDPARFRQLTDNHPPMVGHELYDPTTNRDGSRVAFAARGHVDAAFPDPVVNAEIYLWDEAAGLRRLTTATGGRTASTAPRINADGSHIAFVSQADLAPGFLGNADATAELFVWSACDGFDQVTHSANRPNVFALTADLVPAFDMDGAVAAFVAERPEDPNPLVLTRSGVLVRAVEDAPSPCAGPSPSPTPPRAGTVTPTPRASPGPALTATPASPGGARVCPQIRGRVPEAVLADALAQPAGVYGWGLPENPSLPPGPRNPLRTWLSVLDLGKPWGPGNGLLWRAGCP